MNLEAEISNFLWILIFSFSMLLQIKENLYLVIISLYLEQEIRSIVYNLYQL